MWPSLIYGAKLLAGLDGIIGCQAYIDKLRLQALYILAIFDIYAIVCLRVSSVGPFRNVEQGVLFAHALLYLVSAKEMFCL